MAEFRMKTVVRLCDCERQMCFLSSNLSIPVSNNTDYMWARSMIFIQLENLMYLLSKGVTN